MKETDSAGNTPNSLLAQEVDRGTSKNSGPMQTTQIEPVGQPRAGRATGPRTERGKAISSRNGLKHGFLSGEVVIRSKNWSESRSQFNKLVRGYMDRCKPVGPIETHLLEIAVSALWRYRRVLRAEAGEILEPKPLSSGAGLQAYFLWREFQDKVQSEVECEETAARLHEKSSWLDCQPLVLVPEGLEKVQRYESQLLRVYYRALNELERLQRMRLGDTVPAPVVVDIQN